MAKINKRITDKFRLITNFDISDFIIKSTLFFKNDYLNFVLFFSGKLNVLDKNSIKKLNELNEKSLIISNLFFSNKDRFNTYDFWELLETFEDIKTKIKTTANISKYMRSSLTSSSSKSGYVFDYSTTNNQTLESISRNILSESGYENDWINIALENNLKEVDYTSEGGDNLTLRKRIFQSNLVTSMIDNTIGEKIYGKDINRFTNFKDNDLDSLGYKETVFQTAEILSQLEKGDIPEFPEIGLNMEFYKGVNMSQLNFPSIVREMKRNFSTDDLFQNFEVTSFEVRESDLFIEYRVETKHELVIIKNISK